MQPVSLVAVIAPGSVEAALGRVQASLFQEHGLLSAAALPPFLPVAFLGAPPPAGFCAALARRAPRPWIVHTGPARWVDDWLFLGADTGGLWGALRGAALVSSAAAAAAPFPAAEGFYAGGGELAGRARADVAPTVPALSFAAATIAVVVLRSPLGLHEWWRKVSWEIVEHRPLRGRKAP
jgi:hypothetical protein